MGTAYAWVKAAPGTPLKRKRTSWNINDLLGWIDIEAHFAGATAAPAHPTGSRPRPVARRSRRSSISTRVRTVPGDAIPSGLGCPSPSLRWTTWPEGDSMVEAPCWALVSTTCEYTRRAPPSGAIGQSCCNCWPNSDHRRYVSLLWLRFGWPTFLRFQLSGSRAFARRGSQPEARGARVRSGAGHTRRLDLQMT